ncbi:methionine aminopeptidase [Pseudalkalibacillus caeni]|uniref:Methionine aminopeptidase n=1 Tax=Exobacillus caeni TaxID=2574798 RepID=A0A5R9EZ68_9BACL|nr:methionine aminopeptidase [Pseudalkalibacillus caeni]TLS36131.1 methionine aminopeptidase [Pseudalkalibacillus caeni]
MGLLSSFSEWRNARYQKKLARMEEQGICPDCYGRGINVFAQNEFAYTNNYDCPGCNGSGSFDDWSEINDR